MAGKQPPMPLLIPGINGYDGYCGPHSARYTHRCNEDLANTRSIARGSVRIRSPRLDEGVAFCEPMAGQGFNDQFPYGKY